MKKAWKDIKVGDIMKDGSIVTQVHRTHSEECCKVTYDNDREFLCSYRHVLLIDVSNLPEEGKKELEAFCTFVPIEENYEVFCEDELDTAERLIIDYFCHNEPLPPGTEVKVISDDETEVYDFTFNSGVTKRIKIVNKITKSEPQRVDENTYWLTCRGIEYLMNKYKVDLYCNDLIINDIVSIGVQDCFCISTNTGRYET